MSLSSLEELNWSEEDTHCRERGGGKIGTFMSLSSLEDLGWRRTHTVEREVERK